MAIIDLETGKVWMPDNTTKCEDRTGTEQLKIGIIGPPKGGKSRLAATAPRKPIYFWDYDGRLASVSGMKDVFGKSYLDTVDPNKSTAWAMIEQDMQMFEYQKLSGKQIPGTMVHDSITYMSDRALRKILSDNLNNGKVTTVTVVGNRVYLSPAGWDAYKQEINLIGNMIARSVELGCDVITTFHERPEEAADSTSEKKKFTGKISVHPPRMEAILPLFNEFWRVMPNWNGSQYVVYTGANTDFNGATCLKIASEEEPDISKFFEKHEQALAKEKITN